MEEFFPLFTEEENGKPPDPESRGGDDTPPVVDEPSEEIDCPHLFE